MNDYVSDSEDSDNIISIIPNKESNNDDFVVSSTEDESEIDDNFLIDDPILTDNSITKKRSFDQIDTSTSINIDKDTYSNIKLVNSDLGEHFDINFGEKINNINSLKDKISNSNTKLSTPTTDTSTDLSNFNFNIDLNSYKQYHQLLINKNLSGKFQDWFYFNNNFTYIDNSNSHFFNNLDDILLSFGARSIDSNNNNTKIISDNKLDYDRLNSLLPFDILKILLDNYSTKFKFEFIKKFPLIILDRNFYEQSYINDSWCIKHYKRIGFYTFIKSYFNHVDINDFFIHYRISRILGNIFSKKLFNKVFDIQDKDDSQKDINKLIVDKFNTLIDNKNFKHILYYLSFVLTIHNNNIKNDKELITYFIRCIEDFTDLITTDVELSMSKSLLNLLLL